MYKYAPNAASRFIFLAIGILLVISQKMSRHARHIKSMSNGGLWLNFPLIRAKTPSNHQGPVSYEKTSLENSFRASHAQASGYVELMLGYGMCLG
jgi:hypothetical protein